MLKSDYQYAVQLSRTDGTPLEQLPVAVDLEPAREWAEFCALRGNRLPAIDDGVVTTVVPQWDRETGEPYLGGLGVTTSANGDGGGEACEIPLTYFQTAAQEASTRLVQRGLLKPGELFHYAVAAFPNGTTPRHDRGPAFAVEELNPPLRLQRTPLAQFGRRAVTCGDVYADEFPVFIPESVLEETAARARAAGAVETGGILIGHLHRDAELPEMFAEVTAQIPAPHTVASRDRLTFTADTWTAVRGAIDLRRQQEILLGWYHTHPARAWLAAESAGKPGRRCALARNFFSADDVLLHRAVFPKAYCIGLVLTEAEAGLQYMAYGWLQGIIQPRGFHITRATTGGKRHGSKPTD